MRNRWMVLVISAALATAAAPLAAQGRGPKRYVVTTDRAIVVTREVLVAKGYEVVRIENRGADRIVWYRRGSMGRGRGKGPLVKLVIRRVENRIVFVDVPEVMLMEIDVKLRIP